MTGNNQTDAVFCVQLGKNFHYSFAGDLIQIGGGFIGDDHLGRLAMALAIATR